MFVKMIRMTALGALVLAAASVTASAQDFQKSYSISAGGQVRISNISGDVSLSGYDGEAIVVKATKKGRDSELVEIEDRSSGARVDLSVKYPKNHNHTDASVDFEIQVPRSVAYEFDRIASVSGDVAVKGVNGKVHAASVSGDVHVGGITGSVNAASVSGDVNVQINGLEGMEDMKFDSVSGDVNVNLPAALDADVEITTLSGEIETNFPIEIKKEKYAPGKRGTARLGDAVRKLRMASVSGSISLKHS
jgi:hypothetical protein